MLGSLGDIMLTLDTYYAGSYYYGDLLGLTDDTGRLTVTPTEVEQRFLASRQSGLMDYRYPLEACDGRVVIRIIGGPDFRLSQVCMPAAVHVGPWAQHVWKYARNATLASTAVSLDVSRAIETAAVSLNIRSIPPDPGYWARWAAG